MAGEAISRSDLMAMMESLRAEVTGNMTVELGTAISQLRGELTTLRELNDRALTSIQEQGALLGRYQEGLMAAIETAAENKFNMVNAGFMTEKP